MTLKSITVSCFVQVSCLEEKNVHPSTIFLPFSGVGVMIVSSIRYSRRLFNSRHRRFKLYYHMLQSCCCLQEHKV